MSQDYTDSSNIQTASLQDNTDAAGAVMPSHASEAVAITAPTLPGKGGSASGDSQVEDYRRMVDEIANADLAPPPQQVERSVLDELEDPSITNAAPSAPAQSQTPPHEEEVEEESAREKAFRLRPRSEIDKAAFALMKEDPFLTMQAALEKVAAQNSKTDQDVPAEITPEVTPDQTTGLSVAEIEDRLEQIEDQITDAFEATDIDLVAELRKEQRALRKDVKIARAREAQEQEIAAQEGQAWLAAEQASIASVKGQYPDARNPDSRFATRCGQVLEAWRRQGDPRFYDPNRWKLIADDVALEQGLVVNGQARAVPASQRQPGQSSAADSPVFQPFSGGARTTAPATLESSLSQRAEAVRGDPEGYQKLLAEISQGRAAASI